jgi:hypothetical protein
MLWVIGDDKTVDYKTDGKIIINLSAMITNHHNIFLEGLRKTTEPHNQDSRYFSECKAVTVLICQL